MARPSGTAARAAVAALALASSARASAQQLGVRPDRAAPPERPELRYKDTPPPPDAWKVAAGRWTTGIGVALVAGGAAAAVLNHRLANDLEKRFDENRLTPADASRYRRVDAYNVLSAVLLAAGGVTTGVGMYLWTTAPDLRPVRGGATLGVQGRF